MLHTFTISLTKAQLTLRKRGKKDFKKEVVNAFKNAVISHQANSMDKVTAIVRICTRPA